MTAPLTEERRALAEGHMGLALGLARRLSRGWPRLADEFESAAYFALVKAASTWGTIDGIPFPAWAHPRIRRAVWGVLDDDRGREASEQLPELVPDRGPPAGSSLEDRDAFEGLARRLPSALREVLRLIYVEGLTQREAGERLGRNEVYAWRLHARALRSLTPAD